MNNCNSYGLHSVYVCDLIALGRSGEGGREGGGGGDKINFYATKSELRVSKYLHSNHYYLSIPPKNTYRASRYVQCADNV